MHKLKYGQWADIILFVIAIVIFLAMIFAFVALRLCMEGRL